MKTTHVDATAEKKGHMCPPSSATHPSNRWESLFIYAFITKFSNLQGKIDGLNSPMEFEESLMTREPNLILTQILARFVLNLKPQTRNLSSDQISSTVASVMAEFLKTTERTVFWNEDLKVNVDPFQGRQGGIFSADWDFKLKVLRQLVEFQLCHSADIKKAIDVAWGVGKNTHKKKDANATVATITDDGPRLEDLQLIPIGQDLKRRRYWVIDDSPRVYYSTNPWKITATFQAMSSNRIEYEAAIASLRADAPPEPRPGEKRPKTEQMHHALIKALEERTEVIDAELNRIQRARRKVEQRNLLLAQADLRETRTRQKARPNYAYINDPASGEEDFDEYKVKEDEDEDENYQDLVDDEQFGYAKTRISNRRAVHPPDGGTRRSTRTAATTSTKSDGKRSETDEWSGWRGERRSTRLGAPETTQDVPVPPPAKRARTDDSSVSAYSEAPAPAPTPVPKPTAQNKKSAAALKPTEFALEQVAGKKKSKYWFYAVEPVAGPSEVSSLPSRAETSVSNGNGKSGSRPLGTDNGTNHQLIDELSELSGGDD